MKNILVFCARDWRHPKAGFVEEYAHKVFSRIAAQGNYVGWVCQNQLFAAASRNRLPQTEVVDGIQLARLAPSLLYRTMAQMFLNRLQKRKGPTRRMDAIVDCVVGEPLPLSHATDVPIVPLVFNLSKKMFAAEAPPGPVIAATARAKQQLARAGFAPNFLVQALAGVELEPASQQSGCETPAPEPSADIVAVDASPRRFRAGLRAAQEDGLKMTVKIINPSRVGETERRKSYTRAIMGYCGAGAEQEALAFAAHGVPVVCPRTEAAVEFVVHGETGLLYPPGDSSALVSCIRTLAQDEMARKRMGEKARQIARARTWEKTAGLILATIENLENTGA